MDRDECYFIGGAHLHRGCIVGANTLLSKHFSPPPYSVVAGNPARIIAVKFNIEQILQHEAKLYSSEERFTREQLEELFTKYYEGKRVFGVDANFSEDDETKLKILCNLLASSILNLIKTTY